MSKVRAGKIVQSEPFRLVRPEPLRNRVTVTLTPTMEKTIEALKEMHGEISTASAIRMALENQRQSLEANAQEFSKPEPTARVPQQHDGTLRFDGSALYGGAVPVVGVLGERGETFPIGPNGRRAPAPTILTLAKNRDEITQYSRIILVALQEALDYDPKRHHNLPPPVLRIDKEGYLEDVKALTRELRRLNRLLNDTKEPKAAATKTALDVGHYVDLFAKNYAPAFGKTMGHTSAVMLMGLMLTLLTHLGLGTSTIESATAALIKGLK